MAKPWRPAPSVEFSEGNILAGVPMRRLDRHRPIVASDLPDADVVVLALTAGTPPVHATSADAVRSPPDAAQAGCSTSRTLSPAG